MRLLQAQKIADLLGAVHEEIKLLKLREAAIRAALLRLRQNSPIETPRFTVSVHHGKRLSFDAKRLPDAFRREERYWTRSKTCTVRVGPARCEDRRGDAAEFQVIEDA